MIKVLLAKEAPRAQVTCCNCGSLLEYGNADLHIDYEARNQYAMYVNYPQYWFDCPVCGCKVSASWINKKEE